MSSRYKSIEITCPICTKSKILDIPNAILAQKKEGAVKIQVPLGAVCSDHEFIVFITSNAVIRGYEKIDASTKIHTMAAGRDSKDAPTIRKLIKWFGTYGFFCLIHGKIFNYPIFIVINEEVEYDSKLLNQIADSTLPERYRGGRTILIYKEIDYDTIELNIKDALLLDKNQHILQIPWDGKLKFEEFLVKEASKIIIEQEQLLVIRQIVSALINEAECALNILEKVNHITKKDLINDISKELNKPKINNSRLNLLIEFINRRYSPVFTSKIGKSKNK